MKTEKKSDKSSTAGKQQKKQSSQSSTGKSTPVKGGKDSKDRDMDESVDSRDRE